MLDRLLNPTGVPYRRTRFLHPPAGTYAVYTDDVVTDGPDGRAAIFRHSVSLELYEYQPDDTSEQAFETALVDAGLQWEKQDRYWLQSEQLYQVLYTFDYIEKRSL